MAKIIDRIQYRPEGQRALSTIIVRMEADLRGAVFTCTLEGSSDVCTRGSDLSKALIDVKKAIDEKYAIRWEPKLRVKFKGKIMDAELLEDFLEIDNEGHCKMERNIQFELEVTPMDVAKNSTGDTIYKEGRHSYVNTGDPCKKNYSDEDNETTSLIDDTPETRARLADIFKAFEALHTRLSGVFTQKQILKTLSSTAMLGFSGEKK